MLRYRTWKLRALCWVLRRLRGITWRLYTLKLPLTVQLFVFRQGYYEIISYSAIPATRVPFFDRLAGETRSGLCDGTPGEL
jgi:hypothetical protein